VNSHFFVKPILFILLILSKSSTAFSREPLIKEVALVSASVALVLKSSARQSAVSIAPIGGELVILRRLSASWGVIFGFLCFIRGLRPAAGAWRSPGLPTAKRMWSWAVFSPVPGIGVFRCLKEIFEDVEWMLHPGRAPELLPFRALW